MPVDWSKYPTDWKQLATSVKEATGWRCQVCGKQCYRPGEAVQDTRQVLTVAHVNHVESDCDPANLVAACSVCHLRYDAERRRWQNLARKRIESEANMVLFNPQSEKQQ